MTRIKICGLKTLADVEKVNRYLPEYIGFVFANTKRFVTDEQALAMKQALDKRIQAVGVFVDEPIEHVISLCSRRIIDIAQLHGAESEEYIRALKEKTDITVIKATRVQNAEQVARQMSEEADYMLFDTYKKGELGGTGERFPLEILEESLRKMKAGGRAVKPYFLAGGLDDENVAEVLGRTACFAVDVSTGVETDGVKDEAKIQRFIEQVRNIK
ncbi:MAG: phosphoribosylanthranilate isomerase [Lachnospiraceae bacterium]|nr:phosphoribosylanthranilate isomerase [Lachnospiraceae bacterium]